MSLFLSLPSAKIRQLQHHDEPVSVLAVFLLTHGEENATLHARDKLYRLDRHIVSELTPEQCRALAGKPKLIFVQACQVRARWRQ